jgi:hypothetical protein
MENFSPLSTDIFADLIDLNGGIDWVSFLPGSDYPVYFFDVGSWILTSKKTQWDNQMQQQGINPHLQANSQMWFTN